MFCGGSSDLFLAISLQRNLSKIFCSNYYSICRYNNSFKLITTKTDVLIFITHLLIVLISSLKFLYIYIGYISETRNVTDSISEFFISISTAILSLVITCFSFKNRVMIFRILLEINKIICALNPRDYRTKFKIIRKYSTQILFFRITLVIIFNAFDIFRYNNYSFVVIYYIIAETIGAIADCHLLIILLSINLIITWVLNLQHNKNGKNGKNILKLMIQTHFDLYNLCKNTNKVYNPLIISRISSKFILAVYTTFGATVQLNSEDFDVSLMVIEFLWCLVQYIDLIILIAFCVQVEEQVRLSHQIIFSCFCVDSKVLGITIQLK